MRHFNAEVSGHIYFRDEKKKTEVIKKLKKENKVKQQEIDHLNQLLFKTKHKF